jgi:arylsulfatase A-like enzyme
MPPHSRTLLVLAAWAACASAARAQETAVPPPGLNVVLILADDLGTGDVGCYGGAIPTPNLDALAASGTRFEQAYATAPTCGPSRAALLTGRYQQRCGFEFNTRPPNIAAHRERGLPPDVTLLPEHLRELGMATGMIGKWHLGYREDTHPLARGFDEFFGFLGNERRYLPGPGRSGSDPLLRGREFVRDEQEYLTDAFAREAADFVRRHADKPFFLYAAFNAPHRPHEATEAYLARFPGLSGKLQVYFAMVSALDDAVGRILAALEETGVSDRTLVVFASDNGAVARNGAGSNGALRLGKFFLFEGGVRVPLIVRDPRFSGGRVVAEPVSTLDLLPTLLAAAGGEPDPASALDGSDLAARLRGDAPTATPWLAWRSGSCSALRRGALKLVRSGDSTWLFDLAVDPGEEQDLAGERDDDVRALSTELERWSTGLVAPMWPGKRFGLEPVVCGKTYSTEY